MTERKDSMELWVGKWTPDDVIDRETRLLTRRPRAEHSSEEPVDADPKSN